MYACILINGLTNTNTLKNVILTRINDEVFNHERKQQLQIQNSGTVNQKNVNFKYLYVLL